MRRRRAPDLSLGDPAHSVLIVVMAEVAKPLVYIILGVAGSGRREVLADLLEGGLAEEDRPVVLLAARETAGPADSRLGEIKRWNWVEGTIEAAFPADATHVFFITDGRTNPVDQLEALKPWIEGNGAELGRVLCVVNCSFAEQHHEMPAWYDACIHFSDVVLLNRREGVANKWLSEFKRRYEDMFLPCLFEFVKGGRVRNPLLVLEPQPRRMTHYFDEDVDWVVTGIESGSEDENDALDDVDEEVEVSAAVDPYFALDAAGRRAKRIVDVAKLLPAP